MNIFNIVFFGFYAVIFLTPIFGIIAYHKINDNKLSIIFIVCTSLLIVFLVSISVKVSFIGVAFDAVFIYVVYFITGICTALAFRLKLDPAYKFLASLVVIPFITIPLLSVPAVLGVAFVIGDMEPLYEMSTLKKNNCRVTSFGNATTSSGGYVAHIYNKLFIIEFEVGKLKLERTRNNKITPQYACMKAAIEYRS